MAKRKRVENKPISVVHISLKLKPSECLNETFKTITFIYSISSWIFNDQCVKSYSKHDIRLRDLRKRPKRDIMQRPNRDLTETWKGPDPEF